jgi:hypothetical protein
MHVHIKIFAPTSTHTRSLQDSRLRNHYPDYCMSSFIVACILNINAYVPSFHACYTLISFHAIQSWIHGSRTSFAHTLLPSVHVNHVTQVYFHSCDSIIYHTSYRRSQSRTFLLSILHSIVIFPFISFGFSRRIDQPSCEIVRTELACKQVEERQYSSMLN